jgi:hypothetical protein
MLAPFAAGTGRAAVTPGSAMKNINNIETVDKTRHANLRVKENPDFLHAKGLNLAAITLGELSACTSNFPVLFVQHPETRQTRPVAVFGLRPGENVYLGETTWDATYVPLMIQRHPFIIGYDDRVDDDRQLATCINRSSPLVGEAEGIALFTPAGEETDFLKSRHLMMRDIFEGERVCEDFVRKLQELDLLAPVEILLQPMDGEVRKIAGMQTISQRKLRELKPEVVQELFGSEFLAACYLILASLFQLHKLMQLRTRQGVEAIANYRIDVDPQPQPAAN